MVVTSWFYSFITSGEWLPLPGFISHPPNRGHIQAFFLLSDLAKGHQIQQMAVISRFYSFITSSKWSLHPANGHYIQVFFIKSSKHLSHPGFITSSHPVNIRHIHQMVITSRFCLIITSPKWASHRFCFIITSKNSYYVRVLFLNHIP